MYLSEKTQEDYNKSPALLEDFFTTSNFIEDDVDIDKRLDETDFIDYCDKEYEWLGILILEKMLGKINSPNNIFQDFLEIGYDYEPYEEREEQIPYFLRGFDLEEDHESEKEKHPLILTILKDDEQEEINPEEESDFHPEIEERKAA